jgi:hypothetical protein
MQERLRKEMSAALPASGLPASTSASLTTAADAASKALFLALADLDLPVGLSAQLSLHSRCFAEHADLYRSASRNIISGGVAAADMEELAVVLSVVVGSESVLQPYDALQLERAMLTRLHSSRAPSSAAQLQLFTNRGGPGLPSEGYCAVIGITPALALASAVVTDGPRAVGLRRVQDAAADHSRDTTIARMATLREALLATGHFAGKRGV